MQVVHVPRAPELHLKQLLAAVHRVHVAAVPAAAICPVRHGKHEPAFK